MKTSYFESTWAASCVASSGGAIYAALAATIISRGRIDMMDIAWVVVISIVVSLPVLVAGSATIGWWVTKFLARRVRTNRLVAFAMAGMSMGLVADAILVAFGVLFLGFTFRDIPRTMNEVINATLAASIPVFCLTLAGLVAGAHITHSEQVVPPNGP
jgi:hypothetical protein